MKTPAEQRAIDTADMIIGLWRSPSEEKTELIVLKDRTGKVGMRPLVETIEQGEELSP